MSGACRRLIEPLTSANWVSGKLNAPDVSERKQEFFQPETNIVTLSPRSDTAMIRFAPLLPERHCE